LAARGERNEELRTTDDIIEREKGALRKKRKKGKA